MMAISLVSIFSFDICQVKPTLVFSHFKLLNTISLCYHFGMQNHRSFWENYNKAGLITLSHDPALSISQEKIPIRKIEVIIKKNGSSKLYQLPKRLLLWKEKSSTTPKIIDWTYVMCDPMALKRISFNQQNRSFT